MMSEKLRRLGLIVPGTDEVSEVDYHHYLPKGVVFYTARLHQHTSSKMGTTENYNNLIDSLAPACQSVALANPELLIFSCTSGSFFNGYGWDLEVAKRMQAAAEIPALTTSTAACEALRAVGAGKIFMVSPYPPHVNSMEIRFFKDNGLHIVDHFTFDLVKSTEVGSVTPERIRESVLERRADIAACDVLFISCTGLRAIDLVEALEAALDMPVVTSNSATLWAALHRIGVDGSAVPAGRLFKLSLPQEQPRVA